jgi:hypothetical protein
MDMVFPDPAAARVPVLAVAGDRGGGTIARATARLLLARGRGVGLSLRNAAYFDAAPVDLDRPRGSRGVGYLMRNPELQSLVVAVSMRRVARHGLEFDGCAAAVLLPPEKPHAPEAYRAGLEVLLRATHGPLVVDAEDPALEDGALAAVPRARLVLVARQPRQPAVAAHVAAGHPGVVLEWAEGGARMSLFDRGRRVDSAPLTGAARTRTRVVRAELYAFALARFGVPDGTAPGDAPREAPAPPARGAIDREAARSPAQASPA